MLQFAQSRSNIDILSQETAKKLPSFSLQASVQQRTK